MSVLPRVRLMLARKPWLYWLMVGVCAAAVWLGFSAAEARTEAARNAWGKTRRVLVADHYVATGQPMTATARDYPEAMLPAGALSSLPIGAIAANEVSAGEVVVTHDILFVQALPAGSVVLALSATDAPELVMGDDVSIFGSGQRWCDGVVAAATSDRLEVAVPADCAAAVSAQLSAGAVRLARKG